MSDNVYHPSHYCDGGIETIEFIRAKLTAQEFVGYCKGNALKYVSRSGKKGDSAEDLDKAIVYLTWGAECLRSENELDGIAEEIEKLKKERSDKEIQKCINNKKGVRTAYMCEDKDLSKPIWAKANQYCLECEEMGLGDCYTCNMIDFIEEWERTNDERNTADR